MSEGARGRFQLHLSTAVMLMIAAGGIIGANVYGSKWVAPWSDEDKTNFVHLTYGWPYAFAVLDGISAPPFKTTIATDEHWAFSWLHALIDAVVALAILSVVWCMCEEWIGRRAARKET